MIRNMILTALRNLWKKKGFSLLNIAGLAIGIACAGLILIWVEDELTFNHYFTNRDNLYKVKDRQTYDGTTFTFDATPGPLAAGIKAEVPGIKKAARSTFGNSLLFSLGDKAVYKRGNFVDPDFLSMFPMQFIKGDAQHAFGQLHNLVITENMANIIFGHTDIIGKSIKVDNNQEYTISGVIKDLPKNVSFTFDWLASFRNFENKNSWLQSWGSNGLVTYVEIEPKADVEAINKKLYDYVAGKEPEAQAKMSIYPMNRWRMYDSFENGKEVPGRIKYINLFSLIAWIILIIACINFMNLSTARSEQRAREVGVRKVLGAGKGKLIAQFIGESLIMAFISAVLAVLLMYMIMPAFNTLVEKEMVVAIFNPVHLIVLSGITILCGLLAGSYPAFYLSSFNPVSVLKGLKLKNNASTVFIRKGLVVLQFSVSVILIISTIVIYQQIRHVKDRDLGFNKQDLIYMNLNGNMANHFGAIKNDLAKTGHVKNACLSSSMVLQLSSNTGDITWEGKIPGKEVLISIENVSSEYVSTMGMKIKEGRDFYPGAVSDSNSIIINDALAKVMKKKDPVGEVLAYNDKRYTVVGVVNDFVYGNMYAPPAPLMLFNDTSNTYYLTVRMQPDAQLTAALPAVEKVLKAQNPGFPVEYKFVDENFDRIFKTETLIGKLAGIFSLLAIVISCLGLFGLAAYTAERRTKEIGIRKVLGASVRGVAGLLSGDFLRLVLISCLIASPVAWWLMKNWLQDYEYRIQINGWVFLAATFLAICIALVTISYQAIRAAVANPVNSLRAE